MTGLGQFLSAQKNSTKSKYLLPISAAAFPMDVNGLAATSASEICGELFFSAGKTFPLKNAPKRSNLQWLGS